MQAVQDYQPNIVDRNINPSTRSSLYSTQSIVTAVLLTAAYLAISFFFIGFRPDQLVLVSIFNSLFFISRGTRSFILAFSFFIVYWIAFDYQKLFPNYLYSDVHIQDLYNLEKSWFGFELNGKIVTPNEYFLSNTVAWMDAASGIFYLCWIPVPLLIAVALYFKNRRLFFQFGATFIAVNIIGWTGYYTLPAAPPWYVADYGFNFLAATPGSSAGLARFDALFGTTIFADIYAKSSNVFAAMPSLHSAYILIVFIYGIKARMGWWNVLFGIICLGIWVGAVYTSHHYVMDVTAGILCALLAVFIVDVIIHRPFAQRIISRWVKVTSKR